MDCVRYPVMVVYGTKTVDVLPTIYEEKPLQTKKSIPKS